MSFTQVAGTGGSVKIGNNSVGDITEWSLDKKAYVSKWASSESAGYKKSLPGVKEASGQIDGKFDSAAASPTLEGSQVTLLLAVTGNTHYTVPCTVSDFKIKVNMDTGEVIGFTANFESNGAYTEPL